MPLQIQTVLAATDLTPASEDVLRAAAGLAELLGASLHVVHALETPALPGVAESVLDVQARTHQARRDLKEHCASALRRGVEVRSARIVHDAAEAAIRQRAAEVQADLIVLGPHRHRGVMDRLLGATADRVVRASEVPCLIVRGPLSLPLRRVLVPTDLSAEAEEALREAVGWSSGLGLPPAGEWQGVQLRALHVLPQTSEHTAATAGHDWARSRLRRQVEEARAATGAEAGVVVREGVVQGRAPAEEIVRVAEAERVDLLVVATHGRSAVTTALLGSVASAVARSAPCAVLLVPPAVGRRAERPAVESPAPAAS